MKALVVGGTGFIGSHIVNDLLSRDFYVRVLSRKSRNMDFQGKKEMEFAFGDVRDLDSLMKSIKDIDYVFSAFGILGRWHIPEQTYWEVNTQGVKNLLVACRSNNIRQFIHISSAGVLGPLPKNVIADEFFPLNPSNAYERSKSEAEKEILSYCKKEGIPFTIIRPEFVYGPGDMHVLGLFKAIKARRFFLLGYRSSFLHPTYIDDLINGISLCLDNKSAIDKIYLIIGGKHLTVREIAEIIAEELNVRLPKKRIPLILAQLAAYVWELGGKIFDFEPPLTRSRIHFFSENRAFSYQKAWSELRYSPKVDFREGVRRTISWYKENNCL